MLDVKKDVERIKQGIKDILAKILSGMIFILLIHVYIDFSFVFK